MLTWLAANAANIVIVALLLAAVFFIVRGLIKGRIKTCETCGSGCASCPHSGQCSGTEARP